MVASLLLTAVTCTESAVGRAGGALYRPVASMVPTVEFPPATPFTDQRTVVLLAIDALARGVVCETGVRTAFSVNPPPWVGACACLAAGTVAVNCWVAPARTLALDGLILIPELPLSAQPDRNNAANRRTQQRMDV